MLGGFGGFYHGDNREVAQSIGVLLERNTWPHDVLDELGLILLGFKEEAIHFFYHFYEMSLRPFALAASLQEEVVRVTLIC